EDLAVALVEFRLHPRHVTELSGANRCEVFRVREQDGPSIANPVVKIDRPLRRFGREVRGNIVDTQRHDDLLVQPSILITCGPYSGVASQRVTSLRVGTRTSTPWLPMPFRRRS